MEGQRYLKDQIKNRARKTGPFGLYILLALRVILIVLLLSVGIWFGNKAVRAAHEAQFTEEDVRQYTNDKLKALIAMKTKGQLTDGEFDTLCKDAIKNAQRDMHNEFRH
jgi:cell division protein FtsB